MADPIEAETIGELLRKVTEMLGRLGILMLGSKALLIPGIFVLAIGFTLQAGATGAVRAIKMSAKLGVGREPAQLSA